MKIFLPAFAIFAVWLSCVALAQHADPGNPIHLPIPKPIYPLSTNEKKIYANMLGQRRKIQENYKLQVEVESTHAKSQEYPHIKGAVLTFGNYFYAEGPMVGVVAPGNQTVELKVKANWYSSVGIFSLYCKGAPPQCMDLPEGVYLAKRSRGFRDFDNREGEILEIPMIVRGDTYVGGVYSERLVKVKYDLLPFDPDRFRK